MTNSPKIAIFDVDKTLIIGDLPQQAYLNWLNGKRYLKFIMLHLMKFIQATCPNFLLRRSEYFYTIWLKEDHIVYLMDNKIIKFNPEVLKTLEKLKVEGYSIILVSAGPEIYVKVIADMLAVDYYASIIVCGFIVTDLLNKKLSIYDNIINQGHKIHYIFSDTERDFFSRSQNNIHVTTEFKSI